MLQILHQVVFITHGYKTHFWHLVNSFITTSRHKQLQVSGKCSATSRRSYVQNVQPIVSVTLLYFGRFYLVFLVQCCACKVFIN